LGFVLSSHEKSTPIFRTVFSFYKKTDNKMCHSSVHKFTTFIVFKKTSPEENIWI